MLFKGLFDAAKSSYYKIEDTIQGIISEVDSEEELGKSKDEPSITDEEEQKKE